MADDDEEPVGIIATFGEEIIRIISPVSVCMLLVVLLVSTLSSSPPTTSSSSDDSSDAGETLITALITAVAFVVAITAATFLLLLLFYLRCTRCLSSYTALSSLAVIFLLGSRTALLILRRFSIPLDPLAFFLLLFNFSVLGFLSVLAAAKMPLLLTQGYLVAIAALVAFNFTFLPEWTTWALLVALALYDLAAVLLPGGPLRLLVELAMSRDEEIPALVYEARPVEYRRPPGPERRTWRERRDLGRNPVPDSNAPTLVEPEAGNSQSLFRDPLIIPRNIEEEDSRPSPGPERRIWNERRDLARNSVPGSNVSTLLDPETENSEAFLREPLVEPRNERNVEVEEEEEDGNGIGLGSSGAIKLGLGDFIFYSVLVGRAAMYDFMTVYACYLAIIAGLGVTLLLLAVFQKALPALPVSILLGLLFYVLTRVLLEVFVVQCSSNLLMF